MTTLNAHADNLIAQATAARRRGDLKTAMAAARQATELATDRLDGWYIWGTTAMMARVFNEAEQVLAEGARRAPPQTPAQGRFLVQRARALVTLGRGRETCEVVRDALNCGLTDGASLNSLGTALSQAGRPEDAVPLLEIAVRADPKVADYWYNLGGVQQFLGAMDAAEYGYERAIALGDHFSAHLALARLKKWSADSHHIDRLKALKPTTIIDTARLNYALFKEHDDLGDTSQAWEYLQSGAQAARQAYPWRATEETAIVDAWRTHMPHPPVAAKTFNKPRRIFIVGLPRSGTTLVERILTAHSDVQALGELQTFGLGVKHGSGAGGRNLLDAATIAEAAKTDPQIFAQYYDREVAYLHNGAGHTIDKLPHNHDYVGLIRRAYPDALIIHVRRDAMDSLFGAYKLLFAHAHRWSYNLDDLAAHYGHYRALMDHWAAFGVIDVKLETLIQCPEFEIRRLLKACELPFEEACLSPHEANGAVATASSAQVRKPINREGVGAWKKYEAQLAPLQERLRTMGLI
ncbi:tetratricopeptide repeat-containing sulfotransferase family protein [Asticcacaulis machinosus]|uniref:Sulfotransferase n=1 Tax=Asticcacaulis machinosus TaxID=2984211 RepID=A0ABT5HKJ8_9CAUL|nr:sulfotransferase [Asticcacaulis machinosus]MDC7676707.1 sulfotransferase [Asticcacaulis machinosus]